MTLLTFPSKPNSSNFLTVAKPNYAAYIESLLTVNLNRTGFCGGTNI